MSELAVRERVRKQGWAAPGGAHDRLVQFFKIALPALIGVLLAYLALAPLDRGQEISFLLDKNQVEVARERLRVQSASYRGRDDKGRPFTIDARSAVQASSREPVLDINGMAAQIALTDGPAVIRADHGRYNMDTQKVAVDGPVTFTAAGGYRLKTGDVAVDLNDKVMVGTGGVTGEIPLGHFSANRMIADLDQRKVTLIGDARLHIVQGHLR